MPRILITGASGFVGTKLFNQFALSGHEVYGTYHRNPKPGLIYMDVQDRQGMSKLVSDIQPEWVIHAAGITRSGECNKNPARSFRVNVLGTKDIARSCRFMGTKLILLSTSHVFPPNEKTYKETDVPKVSFDLYGEQKRIAEVVAHSETHNLLIIRTELLLGYNGEAGPNHLVGQAINNGLTIATNKLRQPLLLEDLADAVLKLAELDKTGIFHIAGPDTISYEHILDGLAKITGSSVKKEANLRLSPPALLDTTKALKLGIRPRKFEDTCYTLESQIRSSGIEGNKRSTER